MQKARLISENDYSENMFWVIHFFFTYCKQYLQIT